MRVVVSDTSAGLLARLLVPLGLLHPFGFDALGLSGERTRWYSTDVGVALL
ncbi:MAG: hypothetical protein ACJ8I9_08845 [Chthoniobacterales bacterium]